MGHLPRLCGQFVRSAPFCLPSLASSGVACAQVSAPPDHQGRARGCISSTMAGLLDATHQPLERTAHQPAHQPLEPGQPPSRLPGELRARAHQTNGGSILETRLGELVGEGVIADYCVCDAAGAVLLAAGGGGVLEADLRANPALAGQFRAAFSIDAEGAEPCGSSPPSSSSLLLSSLELSDPEVYEP